ncbi:MAG: hypothetical protein HWN67_22030 [Candidatus Helarchaeota archaeon]|nr:hypothetical protein [Candidatus Helarchaeota archaeon]
MPDIEDLISDIDKKQKDDASTINRLRALQTENTMLNEKLKKYETKIKELEDKMDGMVDFPTDVLELRAIIGRQRAEITSFESELSEKDFKMTELTTELSVIKERYDKVMKKLQEQGAYGVRLKEKDLEIGEIQTEYETKLKLKDDEINSLKVEIKAIKSGFDKTKIDIEKAAIADVKGELVEKDQRIKTLETELETYKESYNRFQEQVNKLRIKYHMDGLKEDLEEFDFKELEKELSLQLKEKDGIIELNEDKIIKLLDKEQKYIKQIEDLQTQVLESKRSMEEYKELKEDTDKIKQEAEKAKEEMESAKVLMESMKKILETEPTLRIFVIVDDAGSRTLDQLAKALGQSIANTRRLAMELQRRGLVKVENDLVSIPK